MHPAIAEALFHAEHGHRVLGVRLQPFSLWHELALEHFGSPFLRKDHALLLPADLIAAVAICSSAYPRLRVRLRTTPLLLWRLAGGGYARELGAFLAYAGDYLTEIPCTRIEVMSSSAASPTIGQGHPPRPLSMAGDLIAWTGWLPERVMNMPSGEARLWHLFSRRSAGENLDWVTPESLAELERIEKEHPEIAAKMAKAAADFRAGK